MKGLGFMRIVGEWFACDDGVTRPTVRIKATGATAALTGDHFMVDTCADRTVFCAALFNRLRSDGRASPTGLSLQGIGGSSPALLVNTTLEFTCDVGSPVRVHGQFAA